MPTPRNRHRQLGLALDCQPKSGFKFMANMIKFLLLFLLVPIASTHGQDSQPKNTSQKGVSFGEPVSAKWRVGAVIRGRGARQSVLVTLPLPANWPEQRVSVLEESLPDSVQTLIGYRKLKTHEVRQMVAKVPTLPRDIPITISVTVEVNTKEIIEPEDKSVYKIPGSKVKEAKLFLGVSPQVNYKNSKLRSFAKETTAAKELAWEKVAAIYDWIRDNVDQEDAPVTNAVNTFRKKIGCNEDKVFLFVALCRAIKIPARIVYANEFIYAEFMLTDSDGKQAYWFPANVNGVYELGSLAEPRIILQKGHHIKVPEKKSLKNMLPNTSR